MSEFTDLRDCMAWEDRAIAVIMDRLIEEERRIEEENHTIWGRINRLRKWIKELSRGSGRKEMI